MFKSNFIKRTVLRLFILLMIIFFVSFYLVFNTNTIFTQVSKYNNPEQLSTLYNRTFYVIGFLEKGTVISRNQSLKYYYIMDVNEFNRGVGIGIIDVNEKKIDPRVNSLILLKGKFSTDAKHIVIEYIDSYEMPFFYKRRCENMNTCFKNAWKIRGAIVEYNKVHKENQYKKTGEIDISELEKITGKNLSKDNCPDGGNYQIVDFRKKDGIFIPTIECSHHGFVREPNFSENSKK